MNNRWISRLLTSTTYAQPRLRITLPPSDNNPDIFAPGSTQVTSNPDLVFDMVALLNRYLRIAMVVVAFIVIIWMGFKLMTNKAGENTGMESLKTGLIALGTGVGIILISYTVVRLVINLF